jgi:hypothetical protein
MKLNRLESTTQHISHDAVERVEHVSAAGIRRVEAMEGIEGDRQRSLQQDMAEFDPKAIGPFEGSERALKDARQVAAQLTLLGNSANGLLKLRALSVARQRIDDEA